MSYMDYRKHIAKSRLSTEEKADLRSEFLSRTGLKSSPSNYLINKAPHYVGIAALSLLLVAVGASPFAIAAENAEPGDFLYPVKTAVNEPVKKVVRTVVGKKTAEPAIPTQAQIAEEDVETTESDTEATRSEKRQKSKNGDTEPNPPTLPSASIIHAADSQVKKIVDTATSPIENMKIIDGASKIVPVEIRILPDDNQDTKKNDSKDQENDADESDEESEEDVVDKTVDRVTEEVKDAAGTVSDTVEQATKILDISL